MLPQTKINILTTHANLSLFFLIVQCCFMLLLLVLAHKNVTVILYHTQFLPIRVPIFILHDLCKVCDVIPVDCSAGLGTRWVRQIVLANTCSQCFSTTTTKMTTKMTKTFWIIIDETKAKTKTKIKTGDDNEIEINGILVLMTLTRKS